MNPDDVTELLASRPGWMVGRREDDGALVVRERGVLDGDWLSVVVKHGAPAEIKAQDLVAGVLGLHEIRAPGCTCGTCSESVWRCRCGVKCVTPGDARSHVAERVLEVLG